MKKIKIYLAGAMANCQSFDEMNGWRDHLTNLMYESTCYFEWDDLDIVNPCRFYNFTDERHQSDLEVMKYDIALVRKSDIVIVNLNGLNTSIGTAIEMYECYLRDIPVIGYDLEDEYNNIHPWLKCCLTRVEKSAKDLIEYLSDFYF